MRRPKGGPEYACDAVYQDIVPDQRIVYTYDMSVDHTRLSVSSVTVEFMPEGDGTRLVFTEQVAVLDGHGDTAMLERHNRNVLASLDAGLQHGSRSPE